jgi:hypothetical protein
MPDITQTSGKGKTKGNSDPASDNAKTEGETN